MNNKEEVLNVIGQYKKLGNILSDLWDRVIKFRPEFSKWNYDSFYVTMHYDIYIVVKNWGDEMEFFIPIDLLFMNDDDFKKHISIFKNFE